MRKSNLLIALALSCAIVALAQSGDWKEYSFPEDGFSISSPETPSKQPDKHVPNATAYSVKINPRNTFTLRVRRESHPCDVVLEGIRHGVLSGGILYSDPKSLKDISLQGHPGLSYEWTILDDKLGYFRYYCAEGKVYSLSAKHEKNHPFLPEYVKIMNSFRFISPNTK